MTNTKDKKTSNQISTENSCLTKKPYTPPSIESENLNTYGAVCNGTTNGGRKASTAPPNPCNASRLNS